MDLRDRVDLLLAAPKSILETPTWIISARPETVEMRRTLLEGGEARGAVLMSQAYPRSVRHEFRHMIILVPPGGTRPDGRCVARLDNAPERDGPHINDFGGPPGFPGGSVPDLHYHDWVGNRQLGKAQELPAKLLYARDICCRINDIDDGFWWFCQQNQIDATTLDLPGWPRLERLL